MTISAVELAKARDSAMMILDELQLDAFIYELEPRDDVWQLIIECACQVDGGWERVVLNVPKGLLLGSFDDEIARQRLFEYWKNELSDCRLRQS